MRQLILTKLHLSERTPILEAIVTSLLFLVVCFTWGTTWLGIKIAVETMPPLLAAGGRFIIAFPLFVALALVMRAPLLFPRGYWWFCGLVTLTYFSLPYYLISYGELYVSSGLASLIFSTMPVFTMIFSSLLLSEHISGMKFLGIAVGFFSLWMILLEQGLSFGHSGNWGVAAMFAAATLHAFTYVITKRVGAEISVITFNVIPLGLAGFGLVAISYLTEAPDLGAISTRSLGAIVYLGLVASIGGFLVYFYLLKKLSPVVLSFVFIIFPAISVLIGAWYEGYELTQSYIFFIGLMLFGFSLTKLPSYERKA